MNPKPFSFGFFLAYQQKTVSYKHSILTTR